jgi:hypothetical protein
VIRRVAGTAGRRAKLRDPLGTESQFGIDSKRPACGCALIHNDRYLKSLSKNVSDQGLCGGDMSPPNGTCETRNNKSGNEKGIDAGHVGDITSGAAETPL